MAIIFLIASLIIFPSCLPEEDGGDGEELNNPPESPVLISPVNNEEVDSTSIILQWSESIDEDLDALTYEVFFDENTEPSTSIGTITQAPFEIEVTELDEVTTYYWKVIVSDDVDTVESEVWSFTVKDLTPPKVTSHTPENLEDQVIISTEITVEFNEVMLESSIDTNSFVVKDNLDNPVNGSVSYADEVATFTPDDNLNYSTVYTVIITTDAQDLAGNPLISEHSFTFTAEDEFLQVISHTPLSDELNVETSTYITIEFNKNIDISTFNDTTFNVVNQHNGDIINGEFAFTDEKTAVFMPAFEFYYSSDINDTLNNAIKPNYNYDIEVIGGADGVKSLSGAEMESTYTWTFNTIELDYGLYWFGEDNKCEKYVSGRPNPYYDPSKPTIIYAHGWQMGSVERDYGRDNFIWYHDGNIIVDDISQDWRNEGWNTGLFLWNQFADEPPEIAEPEKAEAKIWSVDNGYASMRYRVYYPDTDTYDYSTMYSPTKPVSELFHDIYIDALSTNTSENIRIAGHSLGNQVVTVFMKRLKDSYDAGLVSKNVMPNRLVLLDPYWSGGSKDYLDNLNDGYTSVEGDVGERCTWYVEELINYYDDPTNNLKDLTFVVTHYRTSNLSGYMFGTFGGDKNEAMQDFTCYTRIHFDYLGGITNEADKHIFATRYYFSTLTLPPPPIANIGGGTGASASATNSDLWGLTNGYSDDPFFPWATKVWAEQVVGKDTLDIMDDEFDLYQLDRSKEQEKEEEEQRERIQVVK